MELASDSSSRPQRRFEPLKALLERRDLLGAKSADQRRLCGIGGRSCRADEQLYPLVNVTLPGPTGQLGDSCGERALELERRLAPAAGIDVGAGAQRQLLAGQNYVATTQHRGQPLLRAEDCLALSSPATDRHLNRGAPTAACNLLAGSDADAYYERLAWSDSVRVWIGRGDPLALKYRIDNGQAG